MGNGRFMLEPMVLAKLLQAAALRDNERALVVAAGTGYGAAVLAACGCRVTALEDDPALLALARDVLAVEAPGVTLVSGPLAAAGWGRRHTTSFSSRGPCRKSPLPDGSDASGNGTEHRRHLCPEGRVTQAVIAEATALGAQACRTLFDCTTPPIPSLRKAPVFAF